MSGSMTKNNLLTIMRASRLLIVLATMAMMIWSAGTANAVTNDFDRDKLSNNVEKSVTHTSPRDADTDDDGINDGDEDDEDEDDDCDGEEDQDD